MESLHQPICLGVVRCCIGFPDPHYLVHIQHLTLLRKLFPDLTIIQKEPHAKSSHVQQVALLQWMMSGLKWQTLQATLSGSP